MSLKVDKTLINQPSVSFRSPLLLSLQDKPIKFINMNKIEIFIEQRVVQSSIRKKKMCET